MRDYAIKAGEKFKKSTRIRAIQKFKTGCKIGDMTDEDCLDLLNLVREGMYLPIIANWPYGVSESVNIEIKKDRLERVSSKTCNSFNAVDGLIPVGFYGKKARKQCRNSGCRIVKKKNNRTRCQKFQQGGRKTKRRRKYKKKRRSRKRKSRKSSRKSRRKSK